MTWLLWLTAGILSLIGGFIALANPFAATLTAELLAGWAFLFSGIVIVCSAFGDKGTGSRLMAVIVGIFVALLGIFLINNPLQGIVSLTIAAGFILAVSGIGRIIWAFQSEGNVRWVFILSGVLSLILSFMIFSNFISSAATVLGVLLAVELISNGISLITLALARKSAAV